jgi:hypothetical protein
MTIHKKIRFRADFLLCFYSLKFCAEALGKLASEVDQLTAGQHMLKNEK